MNPVSPASPAYQQTLDYIFNRLPMFSSVGGSAIKKGHDNILELCRLLGNPHQQFKSIHIGGTNGKGSTSHMLAAVFQQAGYTTGLYTSPHLSDFRERIKINGQMVPETWVIDFVEKLKPEIERIQPSFFEITVAMAFAWFAEQKVDIAMIEVGMGGRLDSTNIIDPILSIITNISYDHTQFLGDTLALIAEEKAGIIKPGVQAIIGESHPETERIFFLNALKKGVTPIYAESVWDVVLTHKNPFHQFLKVVDNTNHTLHELELDLTGKYQLKNVRNVLTAYLLLKDEWGLHWNHVTDALKHVKKLTGLQGRWDVLQQHPLTVLDVAHNVAGIQMVLEQLKETTYQHLHIVLGMVKDKDINTVLAMLPKEATYYFTKAQIPRALPEAELQIQASTHELQGHSFPTVAEAFANARTKAQPDDMVLVCGSCFVVAEVV
jgi:dihydrofolate synthase/folylpolyglutamate synthase